MSPRPGLFRQSSSGGFSMALASDKHPGAAKEKADAHKPEDQDATLVLSESPSENESTNVVLALCHLSPTEVVAPTQFLSTPKQTVTPLDQTLNLPAEPVPAVGNKPKGE